MSTQNFQKCYSVLGVFHDDDWETIRAAYKRQIRRWHPDKFQDPDQKNIAEIKSRELNHAFQLLDDYYRENGFLPSEEPHNSPAKPSADTAPKSQFGNTTPPTQFRQTASANESNVQPAPRRGRTSAITLIIVILAGLLLLDPQLGIEPLGQQAENPLVAPLTAPTMGNESANSADPYQPETQLNATDLSSEVQGQQTHITEADGLITIGSSMKEVLKIQGNPFRRTESSWEYGLSRIDFHNGRVVGWHESPMNPLRVKH